MIQDLATQLREGTRQSHAMAENTAYMKCFIQGVVNREAFRKLLSDLYFVYSALEEELYKHRHHVVINSIYFPELNRQANLKADLAYYYGDCEPSRRHRWQKSIFPSQAARNYVFRLHQIPVSEPILLVAHAYVRYLGDLSGGQGLKNIVRTALDLPEGLGTRFYEFDALTSISEIREFKGQYRNALNSLPIDEELAARIVEEANYAFSLNCELLNSLEPEIKAATEEKGYTAIF